MVTVLAMVLATWPWTANTGNAGQCFVSNGAGNTPSWQACPGSGAPTDATYWTGSANATLSAEHNLGALSTGLVLNTAGTPSAYAGSTCGANQWATSTNASGALTCSQPAFSDLSGAATDSQIPNTITVDLATAATALAANPADCAADRYATTIAASGALTCAQVSLSAGVTGTLPIGNGGTGQTAAGAAFDALSPVTTRGDMVYRSATSNARLAVGTNGQCLTSNGTDPTWGSCSAGGGAPRNTITLAANYDNNAFTAAPADVCTLAGTNLGTTYKVFGSPAIVTMDDFTAARITVRYKNAGGQSGTVTCEVKNFTDGTVLVGPTAGTTSTTCTEQTATAAIALTGQKVVWCECKSTTGTDDPIFGPCTLELA